jgi:hypothetical protein
MPGASNAKRLSRGRDLCKDSLPATDEHAFVPDATMNPILLINARNGSRVVYTPQLLFNGKDYRRGLARDDVAQRTSAAN